VLHHNLVVASLKQSERDMPRMSLRNGVTDGTKMTASERVGNMFILLCCAIHTTDGHGIFREGLKAYHISLTAFKDCI
jgi:hypothetical protein